MIKIKFVLLALVVTFHLTAQNTTDKYDSLMTSVFEENGPGGIALVVKDGEILYRKAFGMADMELGVKMTPDNIIRIGSITKQFTASAILKLTEEGKLNLQDDITKYIPDYRTDGHKVTIDQLLAHTSGIKNFRNVETWTDDSPKLHHSLEERIELFKHEPMEFIPGDKYSYNGSGYIISAYIIEKLSGKKYPEYIDENFFKPLGMTNSYYEFSADIIKNRARGYAKVKGIYKNAEFIDMSNPNAAGSLISTVDDLYKWYDAIFKYKVLTKPTLDKAHSSYRLNNGTLTGYGYGWQIKNIQGSTSISHGGTIKGFLTSTMYLPEENIFVAVFSNCECNYPGRIAIKMAAIAMNKPYEWKKIKLDEALLKSYDGIYEAKSDGQRFITFENGSLFIQRKVGKKNEIYSFEKDKFFFEGGLMTLEFNRDSSDKIFSITSKSTGYDIEWNKL